MKTLIKIIIVVVAASTHFYAQAQQAAENPETAILRETPAEAAQELPAATGTEREITPTVYFTPVFKSPSGRACSGGQALRNVRNTNNQTIAQLCHQDFMKCLLQGSCVIIRGEDRVIVNYVKSVGNQPYFDILTSNDCAYGLGTSMTCLDPFYTVAADPRFHRNGDVIFVPAVRGTVLPTGDIHDGYFVVRDRGGAIKGADRFDFFTGFMDYRNPANPFVEIGLSNKKSDLDYIKIKNEEIKKNVLQNRNYPGLPPKVKRQPLF